MSVFYNFNINNMQEQIQQLINEITVETHPLYYKGQFVADINEQQLYALRLMLLEQAKPEDVVNATRTGYYLLDDEGEDYHLLSNGYLENINTFWWNGEAESYNQRIALLEAEKIDQHQAYLDSQVTMQTKHKNYLAAQDELNKLKAMLDVYYVADSNLTNPSVSVDRFGKYIDIDEIQVQPLPEGIAHFDSNRTLYSPDSGFNHLLVVVYDQVVFDKWVEEGKYKVFKLK